MSATRREFLRAGLGAATLVSLRPSIPAFLCHTALAATASGKAETILVVVQLAGGNDGLNTVVPSDDDQYAKARPTLRIPPGELHRIDEHLGFHPQVPEFSRLCKEGLLTVVQGVGYPNPQQGHFESMRVWHTGQVGDVPAETGWLGRAVDPMAQADPDHVPAVFVGQIARPFSLNAANAVVPVLRSVDQWVLRPAPAGDETAAHRQRLLRAAELPRDPRDPLLEFVQRTSLAAQASSRRIEAVLQAGPASTEYPSSPLARSLSMIAQLIRAELGIRVYHTELGGEEPGGFDTHANQADNHGALLGQLSRAVAAFVEDLRRDKLLGRVLLMTFSEFGRTVRENGRRGTDHGSAAPVFLVGQKGCGGLIGPHPNLTELEGGGQKFHTDFRRVYATLLDLWLGLDSQAVLGERFPTLDLLG